MNLKEIIKEQMPEWFMGDRGPLIIKSKLNPATPLGDPAGCCVFCGTNMWNIFYSARYCSECGCDDLGFDMPRDLLTLEPWFQNVILNIIASHVEALFFRITGR